VDNLRAPLSSANKIAVMTTRLPCAGVAISLVVMALLAGCTTSEEFKYGKPPTSNPRPSKTATESPRPSPTSSPTDEQQILAQYQRFWTDVLPRAYAAPAVNRRAILKPVVVDPALTRLLRNMSAQDADSKRAYGFDRPLRQKVERVNELSLVRGCLDSSKSGLLNVKTGKKISRGPALNPVLVNLRHGNDGVWRVSFVKFSGGTKC
jgi:hypothetical protein